jgi:hypothetical protein
VPSKHSISERGFRLARVAAAGVEEEGLVAVAIAEEWGVKRSRGQPLKYIKEAMTSSVRTSGPQFWEEEY